MNRFSQKETIGAPEMALRLFVSFLIILVGIGFFQFFNKTKPKMKKAKPERKPPVVDVRQAVVESRTVVISALGTVSAEKEVKIKSRINGEVVMVSTDFIPGGLFKKGDVLLKIDPEDYLLDIKRKKSQLSSAQAVYDIEMGYQDVAKEELALMEITSGKQIKDSRLALRKPQLDQAKAQLETAQVNLEAAQLNYRRTTLKAPFNGMVKTRAVNKGSQISAQLELGVLTGTDAYWVEALVPVEQLKWITIPVSKNDPGSRVKVKTRYGSRSSNTGYEGTVVRLTGSLTEKSRMAKLVIRVPDPLILSGSTAGEPLILGSYVSLEIEGKTAEDIVLLPREALRDNDTVWLLKENRLAIRSVGAIWKGEDFIYVREGIQKGESIIVSRLSSPVEGMKLTGQGAEGSVEPNGETRQDVTTFGKEDNK